MLVTQEIQSLYAQILAVNTLYQPLCTRNDYVGCVLALFAAQKLKDGAGLQNLRKKPVVSFLGIFTN
jgi:hypothetical protein